MAFACAYLGHQ